MYKIYNATSIKQLLRNYMRIRRRVITFKTKKLASQAIIQHMINNQRIQSAKNIGLFLSFDDEIDTYPLIQYFLFIGKYIYLPVLHPYIPYHLLFIPYTRTTPIVTNKFYIREPKLDINKQLPLSDLDILFVPLVAFDIHGHRLGMGGGFYDRILQNWDLQNNFIPIGIGYSCQQSPFPIPMEKWDITLPEIITPEFHWRK